MNFTTIIIVIVAFAVGYLFAMLDRRVTTSMRGSRDAKREAREAAKVVPELSALGLGRDAGGQPALRMDGSPLVVGQVTVGQRKRLVWLLNLIRPWVETAPLPAAAGEGPAPSRSPELVDREASRGEGAPAAKPPKPPGLDMLRGMRSIMHNAVITEQPSQGTGILSQIDAILQQKLASSAYGGTYVSLEEGPAGEVVVVVGAQRYSGIEAVPDPAIQGLIREAISEWEKRGAR